MSLHEHLRDLVAHQGPTVVDTAETFRAALDDFLTEDEATTGELNLLVDAVRLGAVVRLRSILDNGGSPQAAISEAGDGFARDRGTDDLPRCRWAVAVVGYALGLVEAADVPPTGPQSIPVTAGPPTPTRPPTPAPPSERPAPPTANTPRTFPNTEDMAPGPVPITTGPRPRRHGRAVLVAVLVAAIVVAAVFAGIWLGSRDDDPNEAADDTSTEPTGGDTPSGDDTGGPVEGRLSEDTVLAPVTDENDITRIYQINVETGEVAPLTDGPDDRAPEISPDRSTVIYWETTPSGAGIPMVLDLASGDAHKLFATPGGCDYSGRPGYNPAGDRLSVLCVDEFGTYVAAYVVDLDGAHIANIPTTGEPQGTPTWTSGNTVVFVQLGPTEDDPTTLWEATIGDLEPVGLTAGTEGWDSHPDWSEEAGLLLFSRHEGSAPFGDLLTLDANGNPGPRAEGVQWGHPAWSPDGTRVVFMIREEDRTERLYTASIDGDGFSEPTPLPEMPGDVGVPAWGTR
jgi:Tol biopolymer transport system component